MASLNKAIIIGRLGRDPEVRHTQSGDAVANFSVATSETWKDKSGDKQERTEWHNVVVWRKLAELCGKYLEKGAMVCVEGKLQTSKFNDRDGNERSKTEIIASSVVFLGQKSQRNQDSERSAPDGQPEPDDDIPF